MLSGGGSEGAVGIGQSTKPGCQPTLKLMINRLWPPFACASQPFKASWIAPARSPAEPKKPPWIASSTSGLSSGSPRYVVTKVLQLGSNGPEGHDKLFASHPML